MIVAGTLTGTGETVMKTEKWNLPKRVRKIKQYISEENSNYMLKVGFEKIEITHLKKVIAYK